MPKTNTNKPIASIGVDIDPLSCYYQAYKIDKVLEEDPVYSSGLPRYLELFREIGIRVTFFVIADDLDRPGNLELLQRIKESGHEIASHSLNHPFLFSALPKTEKERQIREADEKIQRLLGVKPRGFRLPGLDVDEETISILASLGYEYDSSVMPSILLPILKLIHRIKGGGKRRTTGLGKNIFALAPNRPYFPDRRRMWLRGEQPIVEIPLTVIPFFRLPFFASWHLALKFSSYPWDYRLLRLLRVPINYELHPVEMIDYSEGDFDPAIKVQPGFTTPWEVKRRWISGLLSKMRDDYRVMTLREVAGIEKSKRSL